MILIMGILVGINQYDTKSSPIIFGLALMYTFKMPLDMFTLLIGSIAIGLAVDDTIHFMHNFKRYYKATNSSIEAIEKTFFTTGKAMVITTIVLSLGFFAYMFGRMESVQNFGFITGSVIIFALPCRYIFSTCHYGRVSKERKDMIKKILFGLIVTVSFLCSNEARDIVKRVLDRDDGKTLKQDMTMVLIDKSVTRE